MKAIEISEPGGIDVLRLVDRPIPSPGPNEVLIKIAAAGVNRPEVLQRLGLYPPPPGATDIPGLECAGEIAALGDQATSFSLGDKVCALLPGGSYAQYATVDQGACLLIPQGLSLVEAATLPETFFTVWANVFDDAKLQTDETLLVHGGTSGIGVTAITLAKAMGSKVIATAGSDQKCAAAKNLGADEVFNYNSDDWHAKIKALGGADVVLDMTGGDFIDKNMTALNFKGRHVSIAFLRGIQSTINVMMLMQKRLRLTGSTMKARSPEEKTRLARDLQSTVWPLIASGKLSPVIDQTFPLEDVGNAHHRMESGKHIGKIVLEIASE